MAETKNEEGAQRSDVQTADLGEPNPQPFRELAEDLPEGDPVLKAHKQALTADTAQKEAKAHAKIVDESPRAVDTPSGHALKEVSGIANDTERGEEYAREKSAKRWGT